MLGLNDDQIPLKMGALSEAQMQPFLQIIAEVAQYNILREKTSRDDEK